VRLNWAQLNRHLSFLLRGRGLNLEYAIDVRREDRRRELVKQRESYASIEYVAETTSH